MRKLYFLLAFGLFFSFKVSAQYTYKPQGTRFLVGKERAYYGSQKVPGETGPYFKKINNSEETQNLGEIFPQIGLNGRGLFLNFSPNGIAHICELEGTTKVVRSQDGKIYAVVCGNLLVFLEAFEGEKTPEKVEKPKKQEWTAPVFKEEKPEAPARERMVMVQKYQTFFWQKLSYGCPQSVEKGDKRKLGEPFLVPESELDYYLNKKSRVDMNPREWYVSTYQEVAMNEYPYTRR